ncbi:MAG: universal stress protein [Anaerolineae bacterium]
MKILIANSQADVIERAIRFTLHFAEAVQGEITIMGICQRTEQQHRLEKQIDELLPLFNGLPLVSVRTLIRSGDAVETIMEEHKVEKYQLVVVGTYRNRRFRRARSQLIVRQLTRTLDVPLLVVPQPRDRLERVLICTSGGRHGEVDVWTGGTLAARVGASVTVLHVMSQLPLIAAALVADLTRDAAELMEHQTREGTHLRRVLGILHECGLPDEKYRAKVRNGLVVDEIIAEAREDDYDLVVIGAHEVPSDTAWNELRELLQDDITGRILTQTRRPVLVVQSSGR